MSPPFFFSQRLPTLLAIWWLKLRGEAASASPKEGAIIVFRLDAMGDVVLTTPLFRALKAANPKTRITAVVQQAYRSLLVTNPHVDEVLSLPEIKAEWLPIGVGRLLAAAQFYWKELRQRHFSCAISPRWDVDEHGATLLCVLANADRRVGYRSHTSPAKQQVNCGFDAAFDLCLPAGRVQHEVLRNLAVADSLGATTKERALDIRLSEQDRRAANRLLENIAPGSKLMAIGIGAGSASRRWPLPRYAEICNQLFRSHNVWPVVVCSHAEEKDALALRARLKQGATIVSGAPLRQLCGVLERCGLFIGNDSGCAHLAAAMGCKTLVISRHPKNGDPDHFNSPVRFAPWSLQGKVLQPADAARGCDRACTAFGPHCILNVTVDDVLSAAGQLLNTPKFAAPNLAEAFVTPGYLLPHPAATLPAEGRLPEVLHAGTGRPFL